jgi:hypothetical protein
VHSLHTRTRSDKFLPLTLAMHLFFLRTLLSSEPSAPFLEISNPISCGYVPLEPVATIVPLETVLPDSVANFEYPRDLPAMKSLENHGIGSIRKIVITTDRQATSYTDLVAFLQSHTIRTRMVSTDWDKLTVTLSYFPYQTDNLHQLWNDLTLMNLLYNTLYLNEVQVQPDEVTHIAYPKEKHKLFELLNSPGAESLKFLNLYIIRDDPDMNISKILAVKESEIQEIYDIFYPKSKTSLFQAAHRKPKLPELALTVVVAGDISAPLGQKFPMLKTQSVPALKDVSEFKTFDGVFAHHSTGFVFLDSAVLNGFNLGNLASRRLKYLDDLRANSTMNKHQFWSSLAEYTIKATGDTDMKPVIFDNLETLKISGTSWVNVTPPTAPLPKIKSLVLKNCEIHESSENRFLIGGDPNREIYISLSTSSEKAMVGFVTNETPYQKVTFDGSVPVHAVNINNLAVSHLIVTNKLPVGNIENNPSVKIFTCNACDGVEILQYLGVLGKFPNLEYSELIISKEIVITGPSIFSSWVIIKNINDQTRNYRFLKRGSTATLVTKKI